MDKRKRKPGDLLRRAFFNQYNYILLGGAALWSAASGSWLPAIIGAGAEVLWLVLGTDTVPFRRWVEKQEDNERREALQREASQLLSRLDEHYVARFTSIGRLSAEIQNLAKENKGLEALLIKDEMAKLGQLQHSFLKMAAAHQRLSRYVNENPLGEIERDIARAQRGLKSESDPRVQASLRQALTLAQKRMRQYQQIEGAWKSLSVQMETLEKSLDYLKSHILGIGTREELAAELDNLMHGVSSVAELEASTDDLIRDARAGASLQAAKN